MKFTPGITGLCAAMAVAWVGQAGAGGVGTAYEVWLSDQTNSQGLTTAVPLGTHGGFIRVYDGADLEQNPPVNNPLNLDVTTIFPGALASTGGNLSRIHGILPSSDHKHMAASFVVSGHLGIIDGASKTGVCLFRSTGYGSPVVRQNHMSFWSPDGSKLILANQNGKAMERVDVVRNTNGVLTGYNFNAAATLDLVGGRTPTAAPVAVDMNPSDGISCTLSGTVASGQPTTTPSGASKEGTGRTNNSVICPIAASNSVHSYATLAGGGMFVIDMTTTPMAIVAEYTTSTIRNAGCGGIEASGYMHINSGTSAAAPTESEFTMYRFDIGDFPVAPGFNASNTPAPVAVFADPDNGKNCATDPSCATTANRDSHGMVLVRNVISGAPRYIHQFDRIRNNVEVFKMSPPWSTFRHEGSYTLTGSGTCGTTPGSPVFDDPTPDLLDLSVADAPDGGRIYVGNRGPVPLTVSHAATGSCPGLAVVTMDPNRKGGALTNVLPTTHMSLETTPRNISDPHAAIVRVK